jgi:hypothetical protein
MASRALAYWNIEITYDLLRADARAELQTIAGFYASAGGQDTGFWFAPPGLSSIAGNVLGTGDGTTTIFPLVANLGGASELVQATSGVSTVYLDGVVQSGGWSVSEGYAPVIAFTTAPSAGATVSADFDVLWLCRFAEDVADFENFMALLWRWRMVKLQTTRP